MIGVLMGLNAIGVFGFLTRAHLDHMASIDLALADRTADIEARLAIQGRTVADLDRRIGQIDTAIEESTRLGRPLGAMTIADQKRRERAEITAERQREAQSLGSLQIEKAKIDAQRRWRCCSPPVFTQGAKILADPSPHDIGNLATGRNLEQTHERRRVFTELTRRPKTRQIQQGLFSHPMHLWC